MCVARTVQNTTTPLHTDTVRGPYSTSVLRTVRLRDSPGGVVVAFGGGACFSHRATAAAADGRPSAAARPRRDGTPVRVRATGPGLITSTFRRSCLHKNTTTVSDRAAERSRLHSAAGWMIFFFFFLCSWFLPPRPPPTSSNLFLRAFEGPARGTREPSLHNRYTIFTIDRISRALWYYRRRRY